MLVTRLLSRPPVLLLCLALVAASGKVLAQGLPLIGLDGSSNGQSEKAASSDPRQLRQSLDEVIHTLEDSDRRGELLKQLKALRQGTSQAQEGDAETGERHGVLDALADSLSDLNNQAEAGNSPLAVWARHGRAARADARALLASTSHSALLRNLAEAGVGLGIWFGLLTLLMGLGGMLFQRRGWPLLLPPEPRPWRLVAHFLRRVLPWLLTFMAMLFSLQWLQAPTAARTAVLVVAYVALCGRVLTTVVDVVTSLFTRGHRQVAVAIIRQKALRPLFAIGVLVAFSDAVTSERLTRLLGASLSSWLSVSASVIAGLLSGWLILRIRRPVTHLISNRPYSQRQDQSTLRSMVCFLARLWHVPALFFIGTPLVAILLTGGEANGALPKAIICAVLLVVTLVLTGVLRRYSEKVSRRRRKTQYRLRLARFGYTLTHCVFWIMFVELSLRVWGLSLLSISERSAISALIGQALLGLGLTILLAWLVWIFADTAIERALGGTRDAHGRQRTNTRAQTITPMIRNVVFFTILVIAGIVGLSNLGVNVTPLLAGAGVIGLAIGFGAQTLVQDLITGIFILIEDSLAVGDFVEINGYMGTVEGLNLRTVRLRDLDGIVHIITFSHIDSIHNMSRQFGIALMKIRIPYDMPIDDAIALMKDTAAELREDPLMRYQVWSPLEMQGIHSFEDGCAVLRMRLRTAPEYQWDVARAFNLLLKRRMEAQFVNLGAPRLSISMESQGGRRYDGKGREQESGDASGRQPGEAGAADPQGDTNIRGASPDPG